MERAEESTQESGRRSGVRRGRLLKLAKRDAPGRPSFARPLVIFFTNELTTVRP